MGGTIYGTSQPDPSFISRVRNFLRPKPTLTLEEPTAPKKVKGFLERIVDILTSPLPEFKKRSAYFRERRRMVLRYDAPKAGDRYWTSDGQGYERQKDGSIRRIDEPAPRGYVQRLRASCQA